MRKRMLLTTAVVFLVAASMAPAAKANEKAAGAKAAPAQTNALAAKILPAYLSIQSALASDNLNNVNKSAKAFMAAVNDAKAKAMKEKKSKTYIDSLGDLAYAMSHLSAKGVEIDHAREHFGKLSELMVAWVKENVSEKDGAKYQMFYCGMAKHAWLQKSGEKIRNPYYGASMSECGEKQAIFGKSSGGSAEHKDMHGMKGM